MHSRKVKMFGLGGAVLALLVLVGIAAWSSSSLRAAAGEGKDSKIKALLKERHAILEQVVAMTNEEYRIARIPRSQVLEAIKAAHNAELDLCETAQERVVVLEKMLTEAKDYEATIESELKAAKAARSAVLKATANRLEVEIALERAKAK